MPAKHEAPAKPPSERRCPPPPDRDALTLEERAIYDAVMDRFENHPRWGRYWRDTPHRYFAALLNSPTLGLLIAETGRFFRTGEGRGSYSHAEREWIDQVIAVELDDNRIVGHHLLDAISVGVRPEAVKALRAGRDDELTADEREFTTYIRQVIHGEVTDAIWQAMRDRFGVKGLVEVTSFIAFLLLTLRIQQAFDVWYDETAPPDDPMSATTDAELDQLVDAFIAGDVELSDPEASIPDAQIRIAL
jgi:hypothetical protein